MSARGSRRARPRVLVPDGHGGRRLSNGAFVLVLIGMLGVGLGGVVVLSTQIQDQQTQLERLQDQAEQTSHHEAALQGEVERLSTTNSLASMAAALGMVPNTNPLIIQMPDGTSHGTPVPMEGTEMPGVAAPTAGAPAAGSSAGSSASAPSGPPTSSPTGSGSAPSPRAGG